MIGSNHVTNQSGVQAGSRDSMGHTISASRLHSDTLLLLLPQNGYSDSLFEGLHKERLKPFLRR